MQTCSRPLAARLALLPCLLMLALVIWPGETRCATTNTTTTSAADSAGVNPDSLLARFLAGPMRCVDEIVFAARALNQTDGHWYANFGYYSYDPNRKAYANGTKLYRLNLRTRELTALLVDETGGVRDPQVSYDGKRILFSYRPGGTEQYHLYEMDLGQAEANPKSEILNPKLKQLTSGQFDDIEPTYLPDGGIIFVSSRCKRWVNCWLTQVAVLHRCDADGSNLRALSSNNEHDNTPWPLPDGRILYTRWEYVDRSQVHFHHLWAANPDGTAQTVWFGNLHPGITMIDAKPIPGSDKIVASFSPGHGQREHDGVITVVDPKGGPDAKELARKISTSSRFRDPWAFNEDCFLAASRDTLVLMDATGRTEELVKLSAADRAAKLECHEPRPLAPRPRELVIQPRTKPEDSTGRMLLADVHHGRNMTGVKPGEIKKLLVLETLPMPIHYTGGMEPISYGGTFTLERILGTVPVAADGSAYFEVPAMRSVFFVALDENDMAVKRMQSFTSVQPGEILSCVGCHEHRAQTPSAGFHETLAVRKPAARIEPIRDAPQVFDFPRDVQPILDALCAECHGYEKTARGGPRAGRLILTGDRGPLYSHSYYMLTIARLFADGRNQPKSNYDPRALGSSASKLLTMLDGSHYGVQATPHQKKMLRLWIESAAAYPGTYAALGCGMIGNYSENNQINTGADWPATQAATEVIQQRCVGCHDEPSRRLPLNLADERGVSFWQPSLDDPRLLTSRHIVFNLTRPEKSIMLLAPLAKAAGGWGACRDLKSNQPAAVFADQNDPGYRALLALINAGKVYLAKDTRFDMPGFQPSADWVREMIRYGVLPESMKPEEVSDVYAVEEKYWESLWHRPVFASTHSQAQNQ
ncbi:MAG: PD40 domain-containing protein [Verrucomicrobia bacterium]|nr:PD40 domain-containing protein [Verrucomicrobiota bacterium]